MRARVEAFALALLAACGAPSPAPGTGGGVLPEGDCGRGLVVVQSDYQSTNVSLMTPDGEVLSSSFISSGSADPGLSAALSGDVSAPTARVVGPDVVLVDRYPASVVTWVDVATAEVRAQLDVRTGFASNPQDYLRVEENKAYVSRLETNPSPGDQAHDLGGDLLVVDPTVPAIVDRIDLHGLVSDAPGLLPRANRMVRVGSRVVVLLSAYSADFVTSGSSRLALVDPQSDAVVADAVLEGLEGCAGLAAEPPTASEAPRIAVVCSGGFGGDGTADPNRSGLAVLEIDGEGFVERRRLMASDLGGRPLGFSVAFADEERLLTTAMGEIGTGGDPERPDELLSVDLAAGAAEVIHRSEAAFALGDVQCLGPLAGKPEETACGGCWVADAGRGAVRRVEVGAALTLGAEVVVDRAIGLPPRYLGRL